MLHEIIFSDDIRMVFFVRSSGISGTHTVHIHFYHPCIPSKRYYQFKSYAIIYKRKTLFDKFSKYIR